jgi:predicted transcriptional regulator
MKSRHPVAMTHCPNCGARIVPPPKEMKRWRLDAGLSQREMAKRLRITASYIAYLESGKRSPSASVIARYWKFIPNLKS